MSLLKSTKDWFRYRPRRNFEVFNWIRENTLDATIVSAYQGDGMADHIESAGYKRCLEIGLATGSTAIYMLSTGAEVTSIDRAQTTQYKSIGLEAIRMSGLAKNHRLIEADSVTTLCDLYQNGERYDFIFIDGWKTFDHLATELYFCARMLEVGGTLVFDDAQMPSVRKVIRLAKGHYHLQAINILPSDANKEILGHAALAVVSLRFRSALHAARHVAALKKSQNIDELPVSKDWNFYEPC